MPNPRVRATADTRRRRWAHAPPPQRPAMPRQRGRLGLRAGIGLVVSALLIAMAVSVAVWHRSDDTARETVTPPTGAPPALFGPLGTSADPVGSAAAADAAASAGSVPASAPSPVTAAAAPFRPPGPAIAPPPAPVTTAPAYAQPGGMPGPASMRALQAPAAAAGPTAGSPASEGEVLGVIVFAADAAELPADAIPALQAMVNAAAAAPRQPVVVVPFTSADGAATDDLAQRRAAVVHDALRALGTSAARLRVQVAQPATGPGGPREARRVEVRLGGSP